MTLNDLYSHPFLSQFLARVRRSWETIIGTIHPKIGGTGSKVIDISCNILILCKLVGIFSPVIGSLLKLQNFK
jgi:hypothetical protein